MQKRSLLAYAIAVAGIVILTAAAATTALSREAQKAANTSSYQPQSATSSYAYAPQQVPTNTRSGQCWIATDANRPFGYMGACANPLAYDPALNPVYDGTLHGE